MLFVTLIVAILAVLNLSFAALDSDSAKIQPVDAKGLTAGIFNSTMNSSAPLASPKPTVLKPKTPRKPKGTNPKPKVSKPQPGRKMI